MYEFLQNLFHLQHEVAFIRKRHLATYIWPHDIAGPAEVSDHRYGTTREGFENYACAVVANRWKHHHIRGPQSLKDLVMADPPAEADSLVYLQGSRELFKPVPFRTISEDGESRQIVSQKRSGCAQCEIASLCSESARRRRSAQVLPSGSLLGRSS